MKTKLASILLALFAATSFCRAQAIAASPNSPDLKQGGYTYGSDAVWHAPAEPMSATLPGYPTGEIRDVNAGVFAHLVTNGMPVPRGWMVIVMKNNSPMLVSQEDAIKYLSLPNCAAYTNQPATTAVNKPEKP